MKHFKICGYLEIPENLNWATHVVSIWSKGKRPDDLHFPQPSKRVCQVDFDDIDRPEGYRLLSGEMMHPPNAEDVSRILEFTAHVPSDAQVLRHCAAGVDPHVDDPLGGWMSTEEMERRDRQVFDWAVRNRKPLVWNLAGGYQRDASGSIQPVLDLHTQTLQAALEAFR